MSDLNNQNPQPSQIQPNIQYRTYDAVKITDYDETYYIVLYVWQKSEGRIKKVLASHFALFRSSFYLEKCIRR